MYRQPLGRLSAEILIGLFVVMILSACNSKEMQALNTMYKNHSDYRHSLLKTEAVRFRNDENLTELIVVATYLNPLLKHQQDRRYETSFWSSLVNLLKPDKKEQKSKLPETFIVGFYSDDGVPFNPISLRLNGKPPVSVTKISPTDKRLKPLSFVTPWGHYVLLRFPHMKTEKLYLKIQSNDKTQNLFFSKRAKYLFTKKAFD